MERKEYEMMFAAEDQHWWYVGMKRITITLVSHFYPHRRNLRILDAGCGTGAAMSYLAPFGKVIGCDLSALALQLSQQRALSHLSQATIVCLPFASEWFDLVASFDVLYHRAVGDYGLALQEFHRVLKPGGRLFLRLPAYDWLRSRHDEAVHTAHRFTVPELRQAFTAGGFDIEKLSYANTLLFPLAVGQRLAKRLVPTLPRKRPAQCPGTPPRKRYSTESSSDVHPGPSWQDAFLARFLYFEARWLLHHAFPLGLTVVGVGRKE